ncbi:MAG: hypothetical protein QM597_00415 [Aeromicrobium sp.]|uniref:hypothetical protein n=1 Tax=Aeromicrobium sp. TaxID=1871063 RepID=UPI0039E2E854
MDSVLGVVANLVQAAVMDLWGITAVGYLVSLLGASPGGPSCVDLAGLDLQRSVAYAATSPEALTDLFVTPESAEPEVEALRDWSERGYSLESAMLVIGSCSVVEQGAGEVVLDVIDRLAPTTAVDSSGQRQTLPTDDWSARRVVLRHVDGHWRYASAVPQ